MASHSPVEPVLPWWAGGLGIGLVLIVAVGLVQPIGVSTQYVALDGVLLHRVFPEVAAQTPYLQETTGEWTLATYEICLWRESRSGPFSQPWRPVDLRPGSCRTNGIAVSDQDQACGWCGHSSAVSFCSLEPDSGADAHPAI